MIAQPGYFGTFCYKKAAQYCKHVQSCNYEQRTLILISKVKNLNNKYDHMNLTNKNVMNFKNNCLNLQSFSFLAVIQKLIGIKL